MKKSFLTVLILMIAAVSSNAAVIYPFEGEIDFRTKEFTVTMESEESGKIKIDNARTGIHQFELKAALEHFKFKEYDLSTAVTASISRSTDVDKEDVYTGTITSQYMLVDYKPVREITGSFYVKNNLLTLSALKFGGVSCNGSVQLEEPYLLNLAINLDQIPMNNFLDVWAPNRTYESDGFVSGLVKLSKKGTALYVDGKLNGNDGYIKSFDFDDIRLDIEGIYPHMQISKSSVLKKNGVSFEFEGPINLRDTANFKQQIKELTYLPVVRGSESEREWTIRQVMDETAGKTTLKYMLRKETDGTSNQNSAMLGIEKSLEF